MIKIQNPFSKYSREVYSLMRIVAGLLFAFHGAQLVLGFLGDPNQRPPIGSQFWVGGLIELMAGVMVLIGFLTPFAAIAASGTMAVAYFQFHWKFATDNNFFPIINHGELALLFCFVFLFIAAQGGGKWSVDNRIPAR